MFKRHGVLRSGLRRVGYFMQDAPGKVRDVWRRKVSDPRERKKAEREKVQREKFVKEQAAKFTDIYWREFTEKMSNPKVQRELRQLAEQRAIERELAIRGAKSLGDAARDSGKHKNPMAEQAFEMGKEIVGRETKSKVGAAAANAFTRLNIEAGDRKERTVAQEEVLRELALDQMARRIRMQLAQEKLGDATEEITNRVIEGLEQRDAELHKHH